MLDWERNGQEDHQYSFTVYVWGTEVVEENIGFRHCIADMLKLQSCNTGVWTLIVK